jgi:hypothetical protein
LGNQLRNTLFTLVALVGIAAPLAASTANDTLVVTLKGLPPPISPPAEGYTGSFIQQSIAKPIPGQQSAPRPSPEAPPASPPRDVVGRLGVCEYQGIPIYRGRDGGGQLLARVPRGTYLAIKSDYAAWYGVLMIDGSMGWIPKSAVRLLEFNVVRPGTTSPGGLSAPTSELAAGVLREAQRYLGVPYVWGGNGWGGLDCSGLVKNCFARCGVMLPRRASEQARVGQPVSVAELQPGDRLYFAVGRPSIDHTGIYLGNGLFIHASMSRGRVGIDHLSRPLYSRHLVAARRL